MGRIIINLSRQWLTVIPIHLALETHMVSIEEAADPTRTPSLCAMHTQVYGISRLKDSSHLYTHSEFFKEVR
ncbi:MAG: hypothetical protein RLZZ283_693 [Candidatus Parcubacteria bacterium]|jgi:hypothetical protein